MKTVGLSLPMTKKEKLPHIFEVLAAAAVK